MPEDLLYKAEKVYRLKMDYTPSLICKLTSFMRTQPDFFIGGVQKGGTTSLYYSLIQHPQIIAGKTKETFYYGTTPHYEKGLGYYKQFFGTGLQKSFKKMSVGKKVLTVDGSTNTFDSKEAPQRILKDNPDAKMIFIFRNPVDRAYSHYKMAVKLGWEQADFEKALELEEKRIADGTTHPLSVPNHNFAYQRLGYKARGLYAPTLKHWLKEFPEKNIFMTSSDEFFANPPVVFDNLCGFLGIETKVKVKFEKLNEGSSGKMNAQTQKYLQEYFKPHNEELFRLLNKKFDW